MKWRSQVVLSLGGLGVCALLTIGAFCLEYFYKPGPANLQTRLLIAGGSSLDTISEQLTKAGIITHPWLFSMHTRIRGKGQVLRAGEYIFPAHTTPEAILLKLASGEVVLHRITIVEGITTSEILQHLNDDQILSQAIIEEPSEGELLPETYFFSLGDDRNEVIRRMKNSMVKVLEELWAKRKHDCPLRNPQEALILASIVEKETSLAVEKPRIAAVFLNRLRKGMKLQADPTVIYGLMLTTGESKLTLTRADLAVDTPFNTYLIEGLPPTPICNPGRAALEAVFNPSETDELYFVVDGNGGHTFSNSYSKHYRGHQDLRKLRRQNRS